MVNTFAQLLHEGMGGLEPIVLGHVPYTRIKNFPKVRKLPTDGGTSLDGEG